MPGHTDKKMGSGGMDIPDISREEQVMRDLPKGDVDVTDEELKRLNPNMDFRTADEMEADKARTLQSDMMMLQNLMKNASPREAQELQKMMDFVGSGFTVREVFDFLKNFDPRSVVREGEMMGMKDMDNQADAMMNMPRNMGQMLDPRSVVREGEMMGRAPTDAMGAPMIQNTMGRGALGALGSARRDMGSAT